MIFSPLQTLSTIPYLASLPSADLAELAEQMRAYSFEAGGLIFSEEEPARGLWIIEMGRIKVFKLGDNGEELILHFLGRGDSFNDIAALDGGPNPANAAALTRAQIWLLPAEALQNTLRAKPDFALSVIQFLTGRIRGLVGKLEDLTFYSVKERLARFLLRQLEDPSLSGPGITRGAMAAHLNTTPQTISALLRELERDGAIEFDRHRIVILREDILRAIARLSP